jgi:hypothetical protein
MHKIRRKEREKRKKTQGRLEICWRLIMEISCPTPLAPTFPQLTHYIQRL